MDNDRAFKRRLRNEGAYPIAAIVALVLICVVGLGLASSDRASVAPVPPPAPVELALTESPNATPASRAAASSFAPPPRIRLAPTFPPSLFRGLIGLPPEGAEPSVPETGELVESYAAAGDGPPYRGTARLYADGRLIWNQYYSGPGGPNSLTTGYLEQRLTPQGVELVKRETYLGRKAPLGLLEWLPLDAWEARWPVPYVPSGYGICLPVHDPRPGRAADGVTTEAAQLIEMLPGSVSSLLAGRGSVSPMEWDQACVAQTTDEARVLERVLREAGYDQDTFINNFTIQYSVPVPGADGLAISLMFEPRFPDGSIGCSACG